MFKWINLFFSTFFLLGLSLKISAETLPVIPAGCFDEAVFCTEADVVNKVIDGMEREVINVKVFMVAGFSDFASVDDLLKEADFVSLHVPFLPSTKHLMNEEKLKLMKKSAYLMTDYLCTMKM